MPRTSAFDTQGFYAAIDAVRAARGVTWHGVWRQTYVENCTSAKKRTRALRPEDRAALAAWAGIDTAAFERKRGLP